MDPYDIFPYESIAFPETHPANMAVLGRLFGLNTADPESACVLELGCASGGNLIPMAWYQPHARFLGIDLSQRQIEDGRALIARLGLSNVELRQGDILDLDDGLGKFDYVIAHGIYSWVPPRVREHLLGLARGLLAPEGLFYVSYNTLPGWRMRGMLRDILLYACRDEATQAKRLESARAALRRIELAVNGLDALSARYLTEEIKNLRGSHPSYLYFEYLAQHNQAFLFSEFAADIERHGLRYLCDTDLRTLFPSTYGETVDSTLADIDDGIELEQWLDFVTNRNFRQSLLLRTDATLDDEIDLDRFATLSFSADLRIPEKPDLGRSKESAFVTPKGDSLEVSHPLTKALLIQLVIRYPDCLPLGELMPEATQQVAAAGGGELASQVNECLAELFSLFAHRAVSARPRPLRLNSRIAEKPRTSGLAAAQARSGARRIATVYHGNLDLDSFAAGLLAYLDGNHTLRQAAELLAADLKAGKLMPPEGKQPHQRSDDRLHERTLAAVENLCALFARYGVLEKRGEEA
jgi:methyltransferase-like protein/ubiquinone/menaquinone biosynthesis C-methylase UbiE